MNQQEIIEEIYQKFTVNLTREDIDIYKCCKHHNPFLDWLYSTLVNYYSEFAESNNEGIFDPAIFNAVLFRIIN